MKKFFFILPFLLFSLAGCNLANIFPGIAPKPTFAAAKLGTTEHDVTYCTVDGVALGMDVYYPSTGGPWAVLVYVHGGGWTDGDKSDVDGRLAIPGYLVAALNYRMVPDQRFPAMIEDVKCAIRSLRAHAAEYNLDPERIALLGASAGGHLVALAGTADKSAGWDVGEYLDQSSRVQAVTVIAGPADLTRTFPGWVNDLLQDVFGADQLVSGSPITYASPDDPPFLILHGDADPTVPVEQAVILHDALAAAGVPVELVIVKNGGHGLEPVGGATSPSGDEVFEKVIQFLQRYLEKNP